MSTDPPPRPWPVLRQAPRPVWALVLLHFLLLLGWSVLTPIYHSPDEANHVDAALRLNQGLGWPAPAGTTVTDQGVGAIGVSPYGPPQAPFQLSVPILQADAVPRAERPALDELTPPDPARSGTLLQQITQHPPGYYLVLAGVLSAGAEDWRWDIALATLRIVSVLMVAPLPLLAWGAAFALTRDPVAGVAAATVPLAIPMVGHIGASINNDNPVVLLGGLATVALACVARGDRSRGTATLLALSIGLGLLVKVIALVLLPLVPAAYLLGWARTRRERAPDTPQAPALSKAVLVPSALVGLGALAFGGWWTVATYVNHGGLQPEVPGFALGTFLGDDHGALARVLTEGMAVKWWGHFGYFEVSLPLATVAIATLALGALTATALVRARGRRLALVLLLGPTAVSYLAVLANGLAHYRATEYIAGVQGRYLFIGLAGVAAVAGVGAAALPATARRWSPLLLLVGAGAMQGQAVWLAMRRWWQPPDGGLREAWGALSSWSAWPPLALKVGLLLLVLTAAGTAAALLRTTATPRATAPAPAPATARP